MLRAEERADAEGTFDLLRGKRTDLRIGVAESASAEHRVSMKRADRGVRLYASLAENLADRDELCVGGALGIEIVFGMLRIPRHEIVVVPAGHLDKPGILRIGDELRYFQGIDLRLYGAAERIAKRICDAPKRHRTGFYTQFVVHFFSPCLNTEISLS